MEGVMTSRIDEQRTYPTFEPILDALAQWIKKYRYAVGSRHELARCGPEEVARSAHDLGRCLSPRELVRLASRGAACRRSAAAAAGRPRGRSQEACLR